MEEKYENDNNEIFSKRVKAGKRTYFFDVKSTRSKDYYITITESKRKDNDEGFFFEKHKIFLYKEDFYNFRDALVESIDHVTGELLDGYEPPTRDEEQEDSH